jgi:hypothetical protein
MTAHFPGINHSPHIRYQVYFRLWHTELNEALRQAHLSNAFASLKGIK